MVTTFIHSDIRKQIQKLIQQGGPSQKAADKCKALLYDISIPANNALEVIARYPITHHGETRIDHCVKYDLPGYCRLVTIQDNGWLILLYLGVHKDVDEWLDKNRGLKVAIKDDAKGLFETYISEDISQDEGRIKPESDFTGGKLYQKLKHYWDKLIPKIPSLIRKALEKFDSAIEDEEILEAAMAIPEQNLQDAIFDVFMLLRGGMVDEAKNRILAYNDALTFIEEVPEEEVRHVPSNDQFINLDDLEDVDLKILMSNKDWLEWMLFLHPSQKAVVNRDFKGSSRLLGVSGSGKTCVLVKRAARLAKKYPGEKILILTLNKSLSQLIESLTQKLLIAGEDGSSLRNIEVRSFWELGRDLIIEFNKNKFISRILGPKTDRQHETIDAVFKEYYTCDDNNDDAKVLFPVHRSLLVRNIFPQDYLRQEFDWIRSFLSTERRNEYLQVEREGRYIPLVEEDKRRVLEGLEYWEHKINFVGVTDYLGITNELYKYIDKIEPRYRCILVDEVQDFGTLELEIIRHLAKENENDIFLTGDIAQQVYTKHHKLRVAGITILPEAYLKILKNYRNSREILNAAYEVFNTNTNPDQYKSDDFEILNPEYANFSSAKPHLRISASLSDEFSNSYSYLKEILSDKEIGCIALCGFTIFEIQEISQRHEIPVLDGETHIAEHNIYLSDLEQTKGFEFDRVIIINANAHTFPNSSLPKEEWYREISKLYVAMTRAKKELIISYSKMLSPVFENSKEHFNENSWDGQIEQKEDLMILEPSISGLSGNVDYSLLTGRQFLYHRLAVGMSRELQDRLLTRVSGVTSMSKGKRETYKTMGDLKVDIQRKMDTPNLNRIFGPVVLKELEKLIL